MAWVLWFSMILLDLTHLLRMHFATLYLFTCNQRFHLDNRQLALSMVLQGAADSFVRPYKRSLMHCCFALVQVGGW
jgi:hypothetical protein